MGDCMNLKGFLVKKGIPFEFLEKKSTHHAREASMHSNIPLDHIVKTIVFADKEERPVIAIVRADFDVSRHALEHASGRSSLRLAVHELAEKITGYPTGGIPPVGHKKPLPVYLDSTVAALEYVWAGGGCRTKLVKLKVSDIIGLTSPKICDISIKAAEEEASND